MKFPNAWEYEKTLLRGKVNNVMADLISLILNRTDQLLVPFVCFIIVYYKDCMNDSWNISAQGKDDV
ncbi:conserved domain protein [Paenibacillus sp. HGF5]|nr:conserved domain protein [Paenibacillus sp. HGF5]